MKTHGEMWQEKITKRIAGYCKTRGWTCSPSYKIASHSTVSTEAFQVEIYDCLRSRATLSFDYEDLLDDYGREHEINVENFELILAAFMLVSPPKISKKQLTFDFHV